MRRSSGGNSQDRSIDFSTFIGKTKAELEAIKSSQFDIREQSPEEFSREEATDNLEKK